MINIDLEKIQFDKSLELTVEGWNPLTVNYTIRAYSSVSWLLWKIQDTEHVFQIQYQLVIQNHAGNLKDHFGLVLKTFLEDYRKWEELKFQEEWMKKYQTMFQKFIR